MNFYLYTMLSCSEEEEFLCDDYVIFKGLKRMAMEETIDAAGERIFNVYHESILYLAYLERQHPEIKQKIKECLKGIKRYFDQQQYNIRNEIEKARDSIIEMLKYYVPK